MCAGLVIPILAACGGSDCDKGFAYSIASNASGPSTPDAALEQLGGEHEGAPDSGWGTSSNGTLTNGKWQIHVVTAPGGGFLVDAGSCSSSR